LSAAQMAALINDIDGEIADLLNLPELDRQQSFYLHELKYRRDALSPV